MLLVAVPVPLLLIWAPDWGWVIAANVLLGVNDGLAWGLFPILFASTGMTLGRIGILTALYPAVWGLGQLATGPLSDQWGRNT